MSPPDPAPGGGWRVVVRRCSNNVTDGYGDDGRFFRYLDKLGTYETRILKSSSAGISVSRKLR